jgi:hypothetical protein
VAKYEKYYFCYECACLLGVFLQLQLGMSNRARLQKAIYYASSKVSGSNKRNFSKEKDFAAGAKLLRAAANC